MTGPLLHPRYNLECTFVRRCIPAAMSNSIPNQVEAGSTGSTMAGPVSVANSNPETAAADQAVHATPLAEALKTMPSVTLLQYRGAESIAKFSNATDELAALLNNVGVYDLGWRRLIRCTGEDRMRWLNGMVTNFVGNLDENAGCYAFVLNAQGRIQGDIDIYRRHDSIWLETDASQVTALTAFLDHYIIMDDVTLESQPQWTALGVAGPRAAESIAEAGLPVPSSPLHVSETTWQGHAADRHCSLQPARPPLRNLDGTRFRSAAVERVTSSRQPAVWRGSDRVIAHIGRNPGIFHRHHRQGSAAGNQSDAGASFQQGLLSWAGNCRAHTFSRQCASNIHRLCPCRWQPNTRNCPARRGQAGRGDHQRRSRRAARR